jgi:DNA-binding transcriptional LysR family regulator
LRGFDWNDLRFFLSFVRLSSYQGAAKNLNVDHTTVRRRITALEEALQANLFVAHEQPPVLTPEGENMLKYAEAMEALAEQATEKLKGTKNELEGSVRIGVLDGFGTSFLAPRLKPLLDPHLQIEFVVLSRLFNLTQREADIAIAPKPPQQRRMIVRKLCRSRLYFYASDEYLAANPVESLDDISKCRVITYVPELVFSPEMDYLNFIDLPITDSFQTTNVNTQMEAVIAGLGVGVLPHFIAARYPTVRTVLPDQFSLDREYWLVSHPDTVRIARVRAVVDFIVAEVKSNLNLFAPA